MRKIIYNLFNVLETIVNIDFLMILSVASSIILALGFYLENFNEQVITYAVNYSPLALNLLVVLLIVNVSFCLIKVISGTIGIRLSIFKTLIPPIVTAVSLLIYPTLSSFLLGLVKSEDNLAVLMCNALVITWTYMLIRVTKGVLGTNISFKDNNSFSKSDEVLIKYFDGKLSDANLEDANAIALKYK